MRQDSRYLLVLSAVLGVVYFVGFSRSAAIHRVAELSVSGPLADLVVSGAIVMIGSLTGYALKLWGPIRVSSAVGRFHLQSPVSRNKLVRRPAIAVAACVVAAAVLIDVPLIGLYPPAISVIIAVTAVTMSLAVLSSYAAQQIRSAARTAGRPTYTVEGLHRRELAPADGLTQAAAVGVIMMDGAWFDGVQRRLWALRHNVIHSVQLPSSGWLALVWTDVVRIGRHPASIIRWACCVLVGVGLGLTVIVHIGSMSLATLVLYAAGNCMTSGMRQLAQQPALRATSGRSDTFLYSAHSVIPVVGVVFAGLAVLPCWDITWRAAIVVLSGAGCAVLRRATRPPIHHDGLVIVDPMTGGAVAPTLILQLVRGPMMAVLTGVLASFL